MEVPTQKEVVEKMEWSLSDATSWGSEYYLNGKYEWEGKEWTPEIHVVGDGQAFNWELKQGTGHKQCRTLKDAVFNCAAAILNQVKEHVRKHEADQERQSRLDEHRRKGQEWTDKVNSVTIED